MGRVRYDSLLSPNRRARILEECFGDVGVLGSAIARFLSAAECAALLEAEGFDVEGWDADE